MSPLKKISTFLFLISAIPLFAQNIQHQLISTADGLSQGLVTDILQTRDGYLWIGTADGLNRFDGRRFETFTSDPFAPFSISSNNINRLLEDQQGLIWISLEDNINVFDPESRRFFQLLYQGKPIPNTQYTRFAGTPDGTVWFITMKYLWKPRLLKSVLEKAAATGADFIELSAKRIALLPIQDTTPSPTHLTSIFCTNSNQLLLGTNIGLFEFDPKSEEIIPVSGYPDFIAMNMTGNKSGDIILEGHRQGPYKWLWISNGGMQECTKLTNYGFGLDADGYLWVSGNKSIQKWTISSFFNNGSPLLEIAMDAVGISSDYVSNSSCG